jgi:signal transduction histidine kinase
VHLTTDLVPSDLPPSVNLAAYRIVQEMLTNALRHGDGTLDLVVAQGPDELRITGSNAPGSPAGRGTGRGLDGIRQRAGMFGGTVTIDPAPDVWSLSLTIPLESR